MNQAEHLEKIDARLADIQGAIAEIRTIYARNRAHRPARK